MFQSIQYNSFDHNKFNHLYELTDTEFGYYELKVTTNTIYSPYIPDLSKFILVQTIAIAQEYQRRSLSVGENLALYNIWSSSINGWAVDCTKNVQDKYCPEYISNWSEISLQIDKYIEKYLLLQ